MVIRLVGCLVVGSVASAQAAPLVFQQTGRLTDANGAPVEGAHSVRVQLYNAGGTVVWSDVQSNVPFTQGYYAVVLGTDDTGRTLEQATSGSTPAVELGVAIDGATELSPREAFRAVPRAATADGVSVSTGLVGQACPGTGALAYDTGAAALVVCSAGVWSGVGGTTTGLAAGVTFTTCGASGRFGPSGSQCTAAYASVPAISSSLTVTNGIQFWTVPQTGVYRIEAWGAQGGGSYGTLCQGGPGGYAKGEIALTAGQVLKILVGQQGGSIDDSATRANAPAGSTDGAGGGGTFVATSTNVPLIVAGGGGGMNPEGNTCSDTTLYGGSPNYVGEGGGPVQDGDSGGGGGGFTTNGTTSTSTHGCLGGNSFVNGGAGQLANHNWGYTYYTTTEQGAGGFGGGGQPRYWSSGAGGGGYYGGRGRNGPMNPSLGGGTNFVSGNNTTSQAGLRLGHGQVRITKI